MARCATGYIEKYERNPVYYYCPWFDHERGGAQNDQQIRVLPEKPQYEGATWQASPEGQRAGGADLQHSVRVFIISIQATSIQTHVDPTDYPLVVETGWMCLYLFCAAMYRYKYR